MRLNAPDFPGESVIRQKRFYAFFRSNSRFHSVIVGNRILDEGRTIEASPIHEHADLPATFQPNSLHRPKLKLQLYSARRQIIRCQRDCLTLKEILVGQYRPAGLYVQSEDFEIIPSEQQDARIPPMHLKFHVKRDWRFMPPRLARLANGRLPW